MRLVILALAATLLGGCVIAFPAQGQRAATTVAPGIDDNPLPAGIRLYRSTKPAHAYREVGVVFVTGSDPVEVGARLREEAAALGGQAIIDFTPLLVGFVGTAIAWEDQP